VDIYSWENDFATIKNVWPKFYYLKLLVDIYSWRNDFAKVKNFRPKILLIKIFSG